MGPFIKTELSKGILSPFGGRCRFFQVVRPECSCLETEKGSEEGCQSRNSKAWTEREHGSPLSLLCPSAPCPQLQTQAAVPPALFPAQQAASSGGAALFHPVPNIRRLSAFPREQLLDLPREMGPHGAIACSPPGLSTLPPTPPSKHL